MPVDRWTAGQRPELYPPGATPREWWRRRTRAEGPPHRLDDRSGFQPLWVFIADPWGAAPGWDDAAPLALKDAFPNAVWADCIFSKILQSRSTGNQNSSNGPWPATQQSFSACQLTLFSLTSKPSAGGHA